MQNSKKNKQTKKVELNWNMIVLMDSAAFTAIIHNIPWQAGITGEGGQSICLHSSGGYWSIAQRWKAKLNPVIFLLAPACTGLHFTTWFVFFTPLLHSWLHPSLLHSDQWWYWWFWRSKHCRKWPHAGFDWINDREACFMTELKQPNPSILTHLFPPANLDHDVYQSPTRRALELNQKKEQIVEKAGIVVFHDHHDLFTKHSLYSVRLGKSRN